MAISETGGDANMFTIAEAANRLGSDPAELLVRLIRDGFLYRYTGIGRPLAYVRCVRAGQFVKTTTEVRITQRGLDHVARTMTMP